MIMHEAHARTALRAALAAGCLLLAHAESAHARVELLRWRQPDAAEAEGFQVHLGTSSQSYEDTVDVGVLTPSADGVYAVAVTVPDASTVYVAVSAYNAAGESSLSNESLRPADDGEAPERPGRGDRGSRRLALSWSEETELHAAFDPRTVPNAAGLELQGRLRIDDAGAGIGVTLRDPAFADAFYWLGRDPADGASFSVGSTVSTLECARALPAPEAGAWYRFRFAVLPGARKTLVAAKVWPDGTREPRRWSRCSDESSQRLVAVAPGLWGTGAGVKAWDRVRARPRRG
jgi:hypothetical protein